MGGEGTKGITLWGANQNNSVHLNPNDSHSGMLSPAHIRQVMSSKAVCNVTYGIQIDTNDTIESDVKIYLLPIQQEETIPTEFVTVAK